MTKEQKIKDAAEEMKKMRDFQWSFQNKSEARKAAKKKMQDRLDAKKDD